MKKQPATVLLRNLDTRASQPFEADHADRLLAYPGTRFVKIDEVTGDGSGQALPPADDTEKEGAALKNEEAGANETAPAADSLEVDHTGHPTAI